MIPIVVFWTEYTATKQGRVVKFVPCESCATEYVYLLERESTGVGTSVYILNPEAEGQALSAAEDTLASVLENDYDPIPCPVCGHYQHHMFPKLLKPMGAGLQALLLVLILIGCLVAGTAVYWSVGYLQYPNDHAFAKMVAAWVVLLVLGAIGLAAAIVQRIKTQRFDPNREDPQARIAIGRNRAITRAEFEKGPRGDRGCHAN